MSEQLTLLEWVKKQDKYSAPECIADAFQLLADYFNDGAPSKPIYIHYNKLDVTSLTPNYVADLFSKDEIRLLFKEYLNKQAGRITNGDIFLIQLQGDFLSLLQRAVYEKSKTKCRRIIHTMALTDSYSRENGPLLGGIRREITHTTN